MVELSHPGTPRTRDGKPNLSAPAPRAANGKPDLPASGTYEPTLARGNEATLRRQLSRATNVPGMEIDTISKYALNILLDFKPRRIAHAARSRGDFPPTCNRR